VEHTRSRTIRMSLGAARGNNRITLAATSSLSTLEFPWPYHTRPYHICTVFSDFWRLLLRQRQTENMLSKRTIISGIGIGQFQRVTPVLRDNMSHLLNTSALRVLPMMLPRGQPPRIESESATAPNRDG
jgi:hypothetical protein